MQDEDKSKEQLIAELRELREQLAESEKESSERQQNHKALGGSLKYQRIVDTANEGIWSLDENFVTTYVNARMVEMLGYDESEMIGRPVERFMFEEDLPNLREKMRDRRIGINDRYERRYRHKDGRTVWVILSVTPLVNDEDGSFKGSFSMVTDITERKQMEATLRLSEEKYRSLVETTCDSIWEMDSQRRFTYLSPKFEDLTGYPPEEFLGRTTYDLLPEDEVHKIPKRILSRIAAQQPVSSVEAQVRHRDGRLVTVEVSSVPVFSPEGEYRGMRGITRDITERKRAEEALRKSEERFRVAQESSLDAFTILDAVRNENGRIVDFRWTYVNPEAGRLLRYPPEELVGKRLLELLHGNKSNSDLFDRYVRVVETGEPHDYELPYHSEGIRGWFRNMTVKLGDGVAVHFGDITERKRAEEKLRAASLYARSLIEASLDPLVTIDPDGKITDVNRATEQVTGVPREGLIGDDFSNYFTEPARARDGYQKVLKDGWVRDYPLTIRHTSGETTEVVYNATLYRNELGESQGVFAAARDISERKRAEELDRQLAQQRQQILKAESLNRMAGAIAHLFNNKLMAVMGNLELALHQLKPESRLAAILRGSLKAAEQAAEVSNHMLAYVGQASAKLVPLNLVEVCREVVEAQLPLVPKQITVETEIPDEKLTIIGNRAKVGQILTNLMTNAREATEGNKGKIILSVGVVRAIETASSHLFPVGWEPETDVYACLEVSDTGVGILPEKLDSLFDPFYSTKFTGRGLGLPVVLGTIRLLGGAVAVESEIGRGSTFRVFLPLEAREMEPAVQRVEKVSEPLGDLGVVLVVDDDPHVRNATKAMLQDLGYRVFAVKDGFDAVKLLHAHQAEIHCVLLDLTMPGMDGWETLVELRALQPDIPVILTSGYDEAQVMQGDHPERPQAFLHKPYHSKDLQAAIVAALK